MTALVETSRECWSKRYWLEHCAGFRVDGPEGHLGYVDEVLLDPEGHTQALVVRGARTFVVPFVDIVRVVPAEESVLVARTE